MMKEQSLDGSLKASYSRPELKVFGSVRNLTGGSSGSMRDATGIPSTLAMGMRSDAAAKHNIVEVGRHPAGFGLYLFDYRPGLAPAGRGGRQFGVLAQEVAEVRPDAVSRDADGYLRVDYARLGITLN